MNNLIYQYWSGPTAPGSNAGAKLMGQYADRISVKHEYELNPDFTKTYGNFGKYTPHYGAFKPIFDKTYDQYDYVLFCDTDIIPRIDLCENVFDEFVNDHGSVIDIGICEEWNQPKLRMQYDIGGINSKNDMKWASYIKNKFKADAPSVVVSGEIVPRIFNSGVVMYSRAGRIKCRERFMKFSEYVNDIIQLRLPAFYYCDQPYLHAMLLTKKLDWAIMDYAWNSSVYYKPKTPGPNRPVIDLRNEKTKFIHVQLNGKHHFTEEQLIRIANLPANHWNL